MEILSILEELKEDEYKVFNNKLIPTSQLMLGVRLPHLRKLAREISKGDWVTFLAEDKSGIYELILLEGLVISLIKKPVKELLPYIEDYLKKVDNWAQIDSFIAGFKGIAKEREIFLDIISSWLDSDDEFVVRAALVSLLTYYVDEDYLDDIFCVADRVTHRGYYVSMGNAWLISVCMAKFPRETKIYFSENTLDDITHNRAIQKSRESRRVSPEDKIYLNTLKR